MRSSSARSCVSPCSPGSRSGPGIHHELPADPPRRDHLGRLAQLRVGPDPDAAAPGGHHYVDRDGIHEIYRGWRRVAGCYPDGRVLVGEIWLPDPDRFSRYLRPDELFSQEPATEAPWLPQPASWAAFAASSQDGVPGAMLELYRRALRLRRAEPGLGNGPLRWLPAQDGGLAFSRGGSLACVVNLSADAIDLPPHRKVLLGSRPLAAGRLRPDTAVWLRTR